jgi:hypothetical protein
MSVTSEYCKKNFNKCVKHGMMNKSQLCSTFDNNFVDSSGIWGRLIRESKHIPACERILKNLQKIQINALYKTCIQALRSRNVVKPKKHKNKYIHPQISIQKPVSLTDNYGICHAVEQYLLGRHSLSVKKSPTNTQNNKTQLVVDGYTGNTSKIEKIKNGYRKTRRGGILREYWPMENVQLSTQVPKLNDMQKRALSTLVFAPTNKQAYKLPPLIRNVKSLNL